jgi:hypothetical protein
MGRKHKYLTLTVLFGAVLLLAVGLPLIFGEEGQAIPDTGEFTPRPTSVKLPPQAADIKGVIDAPMDVEFEDRNCTYPIHYWREKPEKWPTEVVLGEKLFTREIVRDIYQDDEPDTHTRLIQQMYTSFLNVLYGADMVAIEDTLFNAAEWLEHNPPGSQLSEFNLRQGREMAQVLEYFNNGEIGPGACPDAPPEPTPTLIPTDTATPEPTSPPPTAVPQVQVVLPTARPSSGQSAPPPPPPAPTDPPPPPPPTDPPPPPPPTDPPAPSPTQPLPTDPPPPTNTPVPPPTSTPVPLPTPTPEEPTNPHPQGVALSEKFGVSYEEIMDWHNQGFGFGDIDKAYELAQDTGTAVSTIFQMLASGMGWGEIREALKP